MTKAYVNDISQFLDVTNKENVKILKDRTLI
jgi:predicted RNA-binding protein with RPS1 domain